MARVDFIYSEKDEKLYLLEVNSIPGLRSCSAATHQVEAMGLKLSDLYTAYIEEALNL
jgi:D-alanine-D-alanine ligase-like ATP-grasp enzyme